MLSFTSEGFAVRGSGELANGKPSKGIDCANDCSSVSFESSSTLPLWVYATVYLMIIPFHRFTAGGYHDITTEFGDVITAVTLFTGAPGTRQKGSLG